MFKVGDKVRVVCDKHGPTWGNKELYIHSPRIGEDGWWVSKRPGAPACTWFFASSLRLPYPDTPAGRKQEQLDLIAEKERIIGECNEAIETARKLISEIDDRPPSVGDKYRSGGIERTIVFIGENHIHYTWISDYGNKGASAMLKSNSAWEPSTVSDTMTLRERITARLNRRRDPYRFVFWLAILFLLTVVCISTPERSIIASGLWIVALARTLFLVLRIVDYDRHKWDNPHYVPKTQE